MPHAPLPHARSENGQYVQVTVSGMNPVYGDWVGVYLVSDDPTVTAPAKYQYLNYDPYYPTHGVCVCACVLVCVCVCARARVRVRVCVGVRVERCAQPQSVRSPHSLRFRWCQRPLPHRFPPPQHARRLCLSRLFRSEKPSRIVEAGLDRCPTAPCRCRGGPCGGAGGLLQTAAGAPERGSGVAG